MCMVSFLSTVICQLDVDECFRKEPCNQMDALFQNAKVGKSEPCDDFFYYVINTSYVLPQHPVYGRNDLESILSYDRDDQKIALTNELSMYNNCQNENNNKKENLIKQYESILEGYGANELYIHYRPSRQNNWTQIDLAYAKIGFGFAFFNFDIIESTTHDFGYPRKTRHIEISPTKDDMFKIHEFLNNRFILNHKNYHKEKFSDLKNFIKELNNLNKAYDTNDINPDEISIAEWQAQYNRDARYDQANIHWHSTLEQLLRLVSAKIRDDKIIVRNKKYFADLATLLSKTEMTPIVDYVHLRFISKTIGFVESDYRSYLIIPRIDGFTCSPGLSVGVANEYMKKNFPIVNKKLLKHIFESVKGAVIDRLQNEIQGLTKEFVIKLKNAKVIIGYPDWLNDTIVNGFYDKGGHTWRIGENTLVVSQLYPMEALLFNKLQAYKDPSYPLIDIDLFFASFTLKEIEFSKDGKHLIIPASMFFEENTSFFDQYTTNPYDPIINGIAATRIAYSLYKMWIDEIGTKAANFTRCAKEYKYFEDDQDRKRATAYLLALQSVYDSWQLIHAYPVHFENFGTILAPQVFFMSYAISMYYIQTRPKSREPSRHFINFAVSNTEGFTDAFGCRRGHKLYQEFRCNPL